jgi:hypothetical protein
MSACTLVHQDGVPWEYELWLSVTGTLVRLQSIHDGFDLTTKRCDLEVKYMEYRFTHCVDWRNGDFFPRAVLVVATVLLLLSMIACSNGVAELHSARALPGGGLVHPAFFLVLSIAPSQMELPSGESAQFTAFSGKEPIDNVVWSSSMGSISPTGIFTAPNVTANTGVRITATDNSNPNRSAIAVVEVEAQNIGSGGGGTTGGGGGGTSGNGGGTSGSGSGGGTSGSGGGSTGGGGTTVTTGPDNRYCEPGNIANFGTPTDGPATLPTACFYTALSATPSPGAVIQVSGNANPDVAASNLQAAITNLKCGDTLALQAGASFLSSPAGFVLPALPCNNNSWITIRTSAPDSSLPAEGSRMTPCYSGVSSLPGRPPFACPSTQVVTAQVVDNVARNSPGAFVFAPGANHYRLIGLELTRPTGGGTGSLLKLNNATQVIFDRIWIHGTPIDDTATAIGFNTGSSYIALIDSYTSDFHCEAVTGTCVDSHVVFGGLGNSGGGPYKVVDDFMEAAGEGLMFGGGAATTTPTDIEIRRNHFFKPFSWQSGNPNFVGGPHNRPFIVKNNFELKNADRVLLEGNLMENVWGGFSQNGFQIVLTPKDQSNKCSVCVVSNVTIRYNQTSHSGAGLTVSAGRSDMGGSAQGLENISIHDNVLDDVNARQFFGIGATLGLSAYPAMFWRNVTITHITTTSPGGTLMIIGSINPTPMTNLVLTNNILTVQGIIGTGAGKNEDCSFHMAIPANIFAACFQSSTITGNVIAGGSGAWPTGQSFPTISQIRFVNYNGGSGGNYQLCQGANNPAASCPAASPYLNTTDGLPAGANIQALSQAIAGVD